MASFFNKKTNKNTPTPEPSTKDFLERILNEVSEGMKIVALASQKITEKEGKLRGVVELTDLNEKNLRIRINSMAELLGEDIDAINDELNAVRKVLSDIQNSKYNELLIRAREQEIIEPNKYDKFITDPAKETEDSRIKIIERKNAAIKKYKSLVNTHNDEVTALKTLLSSSDEKIIESESSHVKELINMLSSQLESLTTAKKELENNPKLSQTREIRQSILSSLSRFDARTNSSALERIRKENEEVEQKLNNMFIEEQKINSLDMQIRKAAEAIIQVVNELKAKSEPVLMFF
jgi:hypothetical protein